LVVQVEEDKAGQERIFRVLSSTNEAARQCCYGRLFLASTSPGGRILKHGPWNDNETAFLRNQWKKLDDAALAVALDRTMSGVTSRRLGLGLKRPRSNGDGRYMDRYSRPPR
jgi:hypothetical protein